MRWVVDEKLHLTLVFLGPTDPARVPSIVQALTRVAGEHEAFSVATGEGGGRANQRRGGVAWLGLSSGAGKVAALARDVDEALGTATYGEERAPRPHLTVARGVSEEALAALREWSAARPPLDWYVDRLVLVRSHTDPGGSRYEPLASVALLTAPAQAT